MRPGISGGGRETPCKVPCQNGPAGRRGAVLFPPPDSAAFNVLLCPCVLFLEAAGPMSALWGILFYVRCRLFPKLTAGFRRPTVSAFFLI